jgi:conjugal transfer pilus assembly protein TraF
MIRVFLLILIIQLPMILSTMAGNDFFKQRYRGWLWFEDRDQGEEQDEEREEWSDIDRVMPSRAMMEQAKIENEEFSQELELLKNMMVRYPENLNYIKLYKLKEKEMMERATELGTNWLMVNFLNPEINDELLNPQNIYGRNIQKQEQQELEGKILTKIANDIELFIFRQNACSHSATLEKHLFLFSKEYGFKVEAVSADDSLSKYFVSYHSPHLVKALNLEIMPTVIAVVKKTRQRFELARGAVSVTELRQKSLLLAKYLELQAVQLDKRGRG